MLSCLPIQTPPTYKLPLVDSSYHLNFSTQFCLQEYTLPEPSFPIVKNYICRKVGNYIVKLTEICLGHQTVVLQDVYEFTEDSDSVSTKLEPDTVTSQKDDDPSEPTCPDRKNVVKNIVKTFGNWLRDGRGRFTEASRSLRQLLRRNKFNNKLIYKLIDKEGLGQLFYEFLQN